MSLDLTSYGLLPLPLKERGLVNPHVFLFVLSVACLEVEINPILDFWIRLSEKAKRFTYIPITY